MGFHTLRALALPRPWALLALALAVTGAGLLLWQDHRSQREAFEIQSRVAHRLLSQQVVQHEAMLATLALLQARSTGAEVEVDRQARPPAETGQGVDHHLPSGADAGVPVSPQDGQPEQRLPALFAQVLRVWRRDPERGWPAGAAQQAMAEAESRSRASQRAELAAPQPGEFEAGRYSLVMAARPSAYALQIDMARMVPRAEWPERVGDNPWPLQMQLRIDDGPAWALPLMSAAGDLASTDRAAEPRAPLAAAPAAPAGASARAATVPSAAGGWRFEFRKHLAAASQPFELVVRWRAGWAALPWAALALWCAVSWVAVATAHRVRRGWLRQAEQRRRAEDLLRLGQVSRLNALGELAAGMAHELNQPLTAVLANTQAAARLLADDPPDVDTASGAMQQAVKQARRASEVVQRLRRVVQPSGPGERLASVDLPQALRRVLDLLAPELDRLGVTPQIAADGTATAQAEPVALEQILHNLLSNALQALVQVEPGERRLELTLRHAGAQLQLQVADSGPGVPAALQPRLFEPFVTTREGGLGLGLSLCETLAASMGGSLRFEPRLPRGAAFVLSLPVATGSPHEPAPPLAGAPDTSPSSRP